MAKKYEWEYKGKWDVYLKSNFPVESPIISFLSNGDLEFNFTATMNPSGFGPVNSIANLSFRLNKVRAGNSYSSLRMNLSLRLYDQRNKRIIYEIIPEYNIKIKEMDVLHLKKGSVYNYSLTSIYESRIEATTLMYEMSFFNDTPIPPMNCIMEMNSEFTNNLQSIYESRELSDVVINVDGKSFPAHKVILGAHSPVFMKMMTSDFKESKTNCVTITDANPETVDHFLKCLYSNRIEDTSWPSVKELYLLADKYDVGFLKDDCRSLAESLISMDLVCDILKLAFTYDDGRLKSAAETFAVNHIKELLSRSDWKDIVKTHPTIAYEVVVKCVPE